MRRSLNPSWFLNVLLSALLASAAFSSAHALERVRWKMQSVFRSGVMDLLEIKVVESIKTNSEGKLKLRFYEPNTLVPNAEMYPAVGEGQLEAAFGMPFYYALTKIPAVVFFSAVPFGPGFVEFSAWMRHGGGLELKHRIYGEQGIIPIECW